MEVESPVSRLSRAKCPTAALSDRDLIARVRAGELSLFEVLMRRHNQRLYRTARAIVQDEVEVEDILQQCYLNAFVHLNQFEARSQVSTWLTRIVINEASARRRYPMRPSAAPNLVAATSQRDLATVPSPQPSPEHQAYAGELSRILEDAVDRLPEAYRLVFMLRDVEGLSTTETGLSLGVGEDVVKTRLHRARAMLRRMVTGGSGVAASGAFQFRAPRCDRITRTILGLITRS